MSTLIISAVFSVAAEQPSMGFVEVGYGQTKLDEALTDNDTFKGFSVAASFEFENSFYVPISYLKLKFDVSYDGVYDEVFNGETFFDTSSSSSSVSEDGLSIRSVYQYLSDSGVQLNGGLKYEMIRIEDENVDETVVIIEGLYHVTENFGIKAGAELGDDKQFSLSARYSF